MGRSELLEMLGMIPNYYLQYYYNTQHKLDEQDAVAAFAGRRSDRD